MRSRHDLSASFIRLAIQLLAGTAANAASTFLSISDDRFDMPRVPFKLKYSVTIWTIGFAKWVAGDTAGR